MNKIAAEEIHSFLVLKSHEFQKTLAFVKSNSSEHEYELYTMKVSQIIALMFDYMDVLYSEYPDLKSAFGDNEN